jgi:hypothetical protein
VFTATVFRIQATRAQPFAWWPLVAATMMTCGSLMTVMLSLRTVAGASTAPLRGLEMSSERIVFVLPRATEPAARPARGRPRNPPRASSDRHAIGEAPLDTGTVTPSIIESAVVPDPIASSSAALSPDAVTRLARPQPGSGSWLRVPNVRDPFAEPSAPTAPSRAQRDSVLRALDALVPPLAAVRVPTRAERDSAAKEATLKMRLSGRTLLVPPDNSGGLIRASIPIHLPGGRHSKAAQTRDRHAFDEGQARLRRLLARADSAQRARQDSLERRASLLRQSP